MDRLRRVVPAQRQGPGTARVDEHDPLVVGAAVGEDAQAVTASVTIVSGIKVRCMILVG